MVNAKPNPASLAGMEAVLASAFGAGDGAFAWKRDKLPEVLETLATANLAIVGGEIWGIRDFEIFPAVPTRYGHTRILAWSAADKTPDTNWPNYVRECARHARQAIQALDAESQVVPAFRHRLVYHLLFFSEHDYPF